MKEEDVSPVQEDPSETERICIVCGDTKDHQLFWPDSRCNPPFTYVCMSCGLFCHGCDTRKKANLFHDSASSATGKQVYCIECQKGKRKAPSNQTKEKAKKTRKLKQQNDSDGSTDTESDHKTAKQKYKEAILINRENNPRTKDEILLVATKISKENKEFKSEENDEITLDGDMSSGTKFIYDELVQHSTLSDSRWADKLKVLRLKSAEKRKERDRNRSAVHNEQQRKRKQELAESGEPVKKYKYEKTEAQKFANSAYQKVYRATHPIDGEKLAQKLNEPDQPPKSPARRELVPDRDPSDIRVVRIGSYKIYHTHPDDTKELCLKELGPFGVVPKETKGKWAQMKAMEALNDGALPCKNCRLHVTQEELVFIENGVIQVKKKRVSSEDEAKLDPNFSRQRAYAQRIKDLHHSAKEKIGKKVEMTDELLKTHGFSESDIKSINVYLKKLKTSREKQSKK